MGQKGDVRAQEDRSLSKNQKRIVHRTIFTNFCGFWD